MFAARRKVIGLSALALTTGAVALSYQRAKANSQLTYAQVHHPPTTPAPLPPSRAQFIENLKQSSASKDNEFDLLIIGGGATGAGVAVDAISRGLKVALVERDDFSSGTSSRSTKLVHGGVRYLEKAVWNLDYNQYQLVKEALHERKVFWTLLLIFLLLCQS